MAATSPAARSVERVGSGGEGRDAFAALLAGDEVMLSRALTLLERGGAPAEALVARLQPHTGRSLVVGFTGPPGAGKSSLINAVVGDLRAGGERVAVLAVDPSSPLSGGAVLGDRTRMGDHTSDPGVYIRSVASRGRSGGLSRAIPSFIDAVDAAGWPVIVLETVGSGQSDAEVVEFADVGVLLSVPGLGDDVQAIKAGMLELADVLVVNKGDLPKARATARQLEQMIGLRAADGIRPRVLTTNALTGDGVHDLVEAVRAAAPVADLDDRERRAGRRLRRVLATALEDEFRNRLAGVEQSRIDQLCARIRSGELSMSAVVARLMAEVCR